MADGIEISIKGLDEIEKRLQALPEKLRRKHLRTALKDPLEMVRQQAVAQCPQRKPGRGWQAFVSEGDEHLRDNITSKISVGKTSAWGRVGVDYTKVRHGHLVEFGTKPHKIGKMQHPGARAHPFMRPAFDKTGSKVLDDILDYLAKAVEREA